MYSLRSNQYFPTKGKRLPSGLPESATYYYFINENGKVVDFKTLKPYKGKQMERYAMHSKVDAEAYLEVINKGLLTGLERYPEFRELVLTISNEVAVKINELAPNIKSEMPYKQQFVLEEVIRNLEERI
jgi:hypothetical protein